MAKQILFLKKNKLDIDNEVAALTATQGNDFVNFVRNRLNTSAWLTTGSVDADNTTFTIDFGDLTDLQYISLVKHNFKAFTIQYWDGAAWQNFSTPIAETTNTLETTYYEFNLVSVYKLRLIVTGTIVANEDKFLYQFIATEIIGRLEGWPVIGKPTVSRQKVRSKLISGKESIKEQIGYFSCNLQVKVYSNNNDLTVFESLYLSNDGFLVLLSGGDEDQFSTKRRGYRKEDFFLMKTSDEYQPEYYKGYYKSGLVVNMDLQEVKD